VSGTAFSPDGRLLAAAFLNTIFVWDTKTGAKLREISIPMTDGEWVSRLAFSPDAVLLAAGLLGPGKLHGRIVFVWRVESRGLDERFDQEYSRGNLAGILTTVAFSPDGKYLAIGTTYSPILITNMRHDLTVVHVESGKVVDTLLWARSVRSLAFSRDDKLAAVYGSLRTRLTVWDAGSGKELRTYKGCQPGRGGIRAGGWGLLAFSPDSRMLAAGSRGRVCLWDVRSGENYPPFRLRNASPIGLAFSTSGTILTVAVTDHTLRLWDVDSGQELRRCTFDHGTTLHTVVDSAFSSGAKTFAFMGQDERSVELWDVQSCTELHKFTM